MMKTNANLLTAALAISTSALVGCLPPGGAYFPGGGATAGGTWTTEQASPPVQPSTPDQPPATPEPPATPVPQWYFQQVTLPGLAGWCLDAASTAPGTPVQLRRCDGSARQQWAFSDAGELRTPDDKCLDAPGGATADGTPLWIWECNGGHAQQFRFHGAALLGPGNKCVVGGGFSPPGWAPAILYSCPQQLPPPPPSPPKWSADPEVISACDFAFSSPASEHACLDAVGRYRYHPASAIKACDFATSHDDHALRCIRSAGHASVEPSETIRACDFATNSDGDLVICVQRAFDRR